LPFKNKSSNSNDKAVNKTAITAMNSNILLNTHNNSSVANLNQ